MNRLKSYFLLIFLVLSACNIKFFDQKKEQDELPESIIGDFKYLSLDTMGRKEWELKASQAKMYNAKNEVYLFNLSMTMFTADNQIKSYLSGDYGFVNKVSLNIYVEGHVTILSENGVKMEANKVYWDNDKEQFYTESNEMVTMTRGNTVINGYNMLADSELQEVYLENTTATIKR